MSTVVQVEPVNEIYLKIGAVAKDRGNLYDLLNKALHSPTEQLVEEILGQSFYESVKDSVAWVNIKGEIFQQPLNKLEEINSQVVKTEVADLLNTMKIDYKRLSGEIPSYESSYETSVDQGELQVKLVEIYSQLKEPFSLDGLMADSIHAQLTYLSHLCQSEAKQWEIGKWGVAKGLKRAQREFLVDHLGQWGEKFFVKIVNSADSDIYQAIGMLGGNFMRLERGNPENTRKK